MDQPENENRATEPEAQNEAEPEATGEAEPGLHAGEKPVLDESIRIHNLGVDVQKFVKDLRVSLVRNKLCEKDGAVNPLAVPLLVQALALFTARLAMLVGADRNTFMVVMAAQWDLIAPREKPPSIIVPS